MEKVKRPKKSKRSKILPCSPIEENTLHSVPVRQSNADNYASNIESQIFDAVQDVTCPQIDNRFATLSLVDTCTSEENGNNHINETELTEMSSLPNFRNVYDNVDAAETAIEAHEPNNPTASFLDLSQEECQEDNEGSIIFMDVSKPNQDQSAVEPFSDAYILSLYNNHELEANPEFVSKFTESQLPVSHYHKLYTLLTNYLRALRLIVTGDDILGAEKTKAKDLQSNLWMIDRTVITERGECQDGNPVSTSVISEVANYRSNVQTQLAQLLTSIKDNANEQRVVNLYSAEVARQNIAEMISSLCSNCLDENKFAVGSLPRLVKEHINTNYASEIRICISILFSYFRQRIKEPQFNADLETWLSLLVGHLQHIASWQDYMFILNHVLRCPPGMNNWVASLVQVPPPCYFTSHSKSIRNRYVVHTIATLGVILLPILKREKFLEQLQVCDSWVVVDVDLDEAENESSRTAITEEDLIKLLNQVPLKSLFCTVLHIKLHQRYNEISQELDLKTWDCQQLLELFAMASFLVRVLREGLRTYNDERYKQFAKRLGCFITNVVKHVSDLWALVRGKPEFTRSPLARLQCEYDQLFQRGTCAIFSSQRLGAWQFLAVLPYNLVSQNQLWKLLYILHQPYNEDATLDIPLNGTNWESNMKEAGLIEQFELLISSVPEAEVYYLLSTFSSMALDRDEIDDTFMRVVVLDLFQIGFLSEATKESCSKSARTLLSNITTQHPVFLSDILASLRDKFEITGQLGLYLFHDLPLRLWIPTARDISIVSQWLLDRHLLTTESNLARLILGNLNYGYNRNGLFLSHKTHCQIAILVVEAVMKYAPDAGSGTTMSVVSNYIRSQSSEIALKAWAWDMISRLRIHQLDLDPGAVWTVLANPAAAFNSIPNLYEDPALEVISRGVLSSQPIACYVALLMTPWGHNVPEICTKGFVQLEIVLRNNKHMPVICALQHMIPLFLDCHESVIKCDKFTSILIGLLTADKTYVKMARNLISPEFPGPILRQLGNMICCQLENHGKYSLARPSRIMTIWLLSLSQIPDWTSEPGVIYLMDIILTYPYIYPDGDLNAREVFKMLYQMKETVPGGPISSIISWISSTPYGHSLMPFASCAYAPYFAALILDIEEESQRASHIWDVLLSILKTDYPAKPNIDAALKKTSSKLNQPVPPTNSLAIYRWAQQALDTPLEHPLLPYLWQRFYTLYLTRILDFAGISQGCVGYKFFEGMYYHGMLKRMKRRLMETQEYYEKKSVETEDSSVDVAEEAQEHRDIETNKKRQWYLSLQRIFKTYYLWLEEPSLHEANLLLHNLPGVYDVGKLALVFQRNTAVWSEYIDVARIRSSQQNAVAFWEGSQFRVQDFADKVVVSVQAQGDAMQTLMNRLEIYDKPLDPPVVENFCVQMQRPLIQDLLKYKMALSVYLSSQEDAMRDFLQGRQLEEDYNSTSQNHQEIIVLRGKLFKSLNDVVQVLADAAQVYLLRLSEHTALDCTLLELLPMLYRNVSREWLKHAVCKSSPEPHSAHSAQSRPQHITCAGAASIRVVSSEAQIDSAIERQIEENRGDYDQVMKCCMLPLADSTCKAALDIQKFVEHCVEDYHASKRAGDDKRVNVHRRLGIDFFYHLVTLYEEDLTFYPPSQEAFTYALESLAQEFIYGNGSQTMRLLITLLEQDRLMGLLSSYLAPSDAPCYKFLEMYHYMVDNFHKHSIDSCFVLLSKFDLPRWLAFYSPTLCQRSTLISYIAKALTEAGPNSQDEKLILKEIFRKHLMILLQHSFPEHFGEVLNLLLKGSGTQSLSLDVWLDFLNALIGSRRIALSMPANQLRDEIRAFATEQRHLDYNLLIATAHLLGKCFTGDRLQYGLYGLYPRYRFYVEPLTIFMGIIGHCLVVATLEEDPGSLTDRLCNILWPAMCSMYTPWIVPFWTQKLEEPTAAWIEQLADDRSVLAPWIVNDDSHAIKVVAMFIEGIRFILETLPGCSNILHYIWEFYVVYFAHPSVKDHILSIIHHHMGMLSWHQFCPTLKDMDSMFKVVNQFLPSCHAFLGSIFIEVSWGLWIVNVINNCDSELGARAHVCLLNLLVKLANEPTVRQKCKVHAILSSAHKFAWHIIDSTSCGQVLDWWAFSYDPRVVLNLGEAYTNPIDVEIFSLLRTVTHFTPEAQLFHPTTLHKRMMFVRACMKLLVQSTTKYKGLITQNKAAYQSFIRKLLDSIEAISIKNDLGLEEMGECCCLLKEVMCHVNSNDGNQLSLVITDSCVQWLAGRDSRSIVLRSFLKVVGTEVSSHHALGALLEVSLNSYFKRTVSQTTSQTWMSVNSIFTEPLATGFEDTFLTNNYLLSLHAILFKNFCAQTSNDLAQQTNTLSNLIDWLKKVKPSESMEAKLPLLWGFALYLIQLLIEAGVNNDVAIRSVRILIQQLDTLSDDKEVGGGFLALIGIRRPSQLSIRCRLLSRAMAVFLMAQLPEGGGASQMIRINSDSPGSIDPGYNAGSERSGSDCRKSVPNGDALKGLKYLESLSNNKNYQELKTTIDLAVNLIKNGSNSLMNAAHVLGILANELYSQQFLLILKV